MKAFEFGTEMISFLFGAAQFWSSDGLITYWSKKSYMSNFSTSSVPWATLMPSVGL